MIYGYIRVSTQKQTVENQRFEILEFCRAEGLTVSGWIEETATGMKTPDKRKLGELLSGIKKDDIIICAELSRLGRTMLMIMDVLYAILQREAQLWSVKEKYRLGDDIQSLALAFAFGLAAQIERQLISQRTEEALALRAENGVTLGRPEGKFKLLYGKENEILEMVYAGTSKQQIAQIFGVSRATLSRFLREIGASDPQPVQLLPDEPEGAFCIKCPRGYLRCMSKEKSGKDRPYYTPNVERALIYRRRSRADKMAERVCGEVVSIDRGGTEADQTARPGDQA